MTIQLEKSRLGLVYNNNKEIMEAGFTMQSKYLLPLLSRLVDAKLISNFACNVIQTILTYKHTEEMPFPSYGEIARMLNKSEIYVKQAMALIKKSRILGVLKAGRKNVYDFNPLFSLLSKFIVEFKDNNNHSVSVVDLLASEPVVAPVEAVEPTPEPTPAPEEVPVEEPVVAEPVKKQLPDKIFNLLVSNNLTKDDIITVESKYSAYSSDLDDKIFIQKIMASVLKKDFVGYFSKCIDNAYVSGEKPKEEQPMKQQYKPAYKAKPGYVEQKPSWFGEKEESTKANDLTIMVTATDLSVLSKLKTRFEELLVASPDDISAITSLEVLAMRYEELGFEFVPMTIEEAVVEETGGVDIGNS